MKPRLELTAREVDELHEALARRLGDTSVPSLPHVAVKIIELISDPNSTIDQFAQVIKSDQALTGRLLRLANSALFAQRQPVTRLERAMVLLGMERLKAVSLGFHLSKVMASDEGPFSLKRVWTQSLFRAWLALHIVETIDKRVSGEAFIVGMLSDAGMTVMTKLLGDEFYAAVNASDAPAKQYLSELKTLPYTHVDATSVLCRIWKLPALLARPISMHHTPAHSASASDTLSVLHAASYYVGSIPLDGDGAPGLETPLPALAKKLFDKDPDEMSQLIARSGGAFKATREMFSHMLAKDLSVDQIVEKANEHLCDAVDDLVVESVDREINAGATKRFESCGLVLELEPTPGRKSVMVFISDDTGNRLVSEEIDPVAQNEDEIKQLLLLDAASRDEVAAIIGSIRTLAA